jgi:hypothetical protein
LRYGGTENYRLAKIWSSNTLCESINYEAERGKNYMTLISWCFTNEKFAIKMPTKFLTQQEFERCKQEFGADTKSCPVSVRLVVDFKINLLRLVPWMSWVFVMITRQ